MQEKTSVRRKRKQSLVDKVCTGSALDTGRVKEAVAQCSEVAVVVKEERRQQKGKKRSRQSKILAMG